ncbi:unnamed protein product [Medioppia subpectinata]|uniref:PH domain-containing protein n=1 Tax=Medioppia subpectinata TaxID=1979941 RepID=A0A7R9QHF8_9ACAR|nr:unnamed protein product [Medioppia subpectinata]CAG2120068.1 unnamed protein product [Medioppia subpectinata]
MSEEFERSLSAICETCFRALQEAEFNVCQFEAQELAFQAQPIEGQLSKYTNVVKGWQYRWFVLNPTRGTLEYHMLEERKKSHPRGCVYLAGCVVSPSEEDSQTFVVSAACGEVYKLKAADAKQRQYWVNKLRQVALNQENRIAAQHPPLSAGITAGAVTTATSAQMTASGGTSPAVSTTGVAPTFMRGGGGGRQLNTACTASLEAVRDLLVQTQRNQRALVDTIETHTCSDAELLLMKATSASTLMSLEQCFAILLSIQSAKV